MINRVVKGVHKNKPPKNGHDVSPALLCIPNQAKKSLLSSPHRLIVHAYPTEHNHTRTRFIIT